MKRNAFSRLLTVLIIASVAISAPFANAGLKIIGDINDGNNIQLRSTQSTYRALIIGNDEYKDPEKLWQPLKRAVSDSRAVEQLLKNNYGFSDVQRVENATRRELLHALRDFSKRVTPDDNVLVYYAGHGFLDQFTNKGYWVPVDAQGTDHTTFVRNSTIRDELSDIGARAKHTLLISDSCFSGTLLKTASRGSHSNTQSKEYLKAVDNKKSVQILTAGGVEYVDDDFRSSGHSPFTYFLRNELENNPYNVITASDLSKRVQLAVSNNVEQNPQMGVLQGAGDELGEFLFIKVNLEVSGVPADRVKVDVNVVSDVDGASAGTDKVKVTKSVQPQQPEVKEQKENKKKNESEIVLPVQSF